MGDIRLKKITDNLEEDEINELVEKNGEFEQWLKEVAGITNREGARKERSEIRRFFKEEIVSKLKSPITPKRIFDQIEALYKIKKDTKGHLELIEKFLLDIWDDLRIEKEALSTRIVAVPPKKEEIRLIGRVSLSAYSPSTPTHFYFWVKDDENIHVEPGTIVTAKNEKKDRIVNVVGIVEDIKATSDVPNSTVEFYSSGYGNPEEEIALERPTIREVKVRIVKRSDGRVEPLIRKWPVYFATSSEIISAYSGSISDKDRMVIGFTFDSSEEPVPIYADFNYMFGFKGAHINISGSSGLAAKTSYALFLITSLLSYAKSNKKEVAVVAFNVKEQDLLRILKFRDNFENFERAFEALKEENDYTSVKLWNACVKHGIYGINYRIDPYEVYTTHNVKILEPKKDFCFGFRDLVELGGGGYDILKMMFDPIDINENFEALLSAILDDREIGANESADFNSVIEKLNSKLESNKQNIRIGGTSIHKATISKFLRRLKTSLDQLEKIIASDRPHTPNSLPLSTLKVHHFYIINIEPLHDKGKRLIFLTILRTIYRILEAKRSRKKSIKIGDTLVDLQKFPSRVIIFVDELNKFAPKSSTFSPIKGPIIEIASRGRSIGLSLIGAQQLASQIDEEIMVNCSTFALGRTHPVEISAKEYNWVAGDLRERATTLTQGQIILFHALHNAPVLIRFPRPLHLIEK